MRRTLVATLFAVLAVPAVAAERFRVDGVSAGDALTIRERPDADAAAVARAPPRTRLLGFGCTKETPSGLTWCRVKYERALGWARRRYLAPD